MSDKTIEVEGLWEHWDGEPTDRYDAALVEITEHAAHAINTQMCQALNACGSPIERQFLMAIAAAGLRDVGEIQTDGSGGTVIGWDVDRLVIESQFKVLKYRVDFKITLIDGYRTSAGLPHASTSILVECDGHNWHDRTKQQAAADRKRSNAIVTSGHTLLRFTGSQIFKDAEACAVEVITALSKMHQREVG